MDQFTVPCTVYRGGTSRGIFFHKKDLPVDLENQIHIFLYGIGAGDLTQVNGLGGGNSHTSKVVIISPCERAGIDINYEFVQVGIEQEIVDFKGTCGNLMAAVGAFAVDEGLVERREPITNVKVYNTNINKVLSINVPVIDDQAQVQGNYQMAGLSKKGAKITIDILEPGGGIVGQTLPLGTSTVLEGKHGPLEVSFADIVNPVVFVKASDVGLMGTEKNDEVSAREEIIDKLNDIRDQIAVKAGMAESVEEAKTKSPNVPKISFVAEPQDYITNSGELIKKADIDIIARILSMGKLHKSFAVSGLLNLGALTQIEGTIPNQIVKKVNANNKSIVRVGHPGGVAEIRVTLTDDGQDIAAVGLERTARRIIKGELYIPTKYE